MKISIHIDEHALNLAQLSLEDVKAEVGPIAVSSTSNVPCTGCGGCFDF